jgi:hypothetical protein
VTRARRPRSSSRPAGPNDRAYGERSSSLQRAAILG